MLGLPGDGPPGTRRGYAASLSGRAAKGCAGRRPLQVVYREYRRLEGKRPLGVETFPDGTDHARSAGREEGSCV